MKISFLSIFTILFFFISCDTDNKDKSISRDENKETTLFTKKSSEEVGITFQNKITETPKHNYLNDNNLYAGGGVAVGDINNDGLADIYFTGNQVSDKIYLNKGELKFEEITQSAILSGNEGWHRGVCMIDINNDGFLDIYVCRSGWETSSKQRSNLLYINNKDLSFTESAEEYGLADTSHSVQAAFFDFDLDGDLDCYVVNQPKERKLGEPVYTVEKVKGLITNGKAESDKLYRNNGDGTFIDISQQAGTYNLAYGLALGISDFDNNGFPDIYVSNDYAEPDFLYMNQGDGTFKNEINQRTGHVSNFGMGVDVADFNGDQLQDIMVLDMAFKSMIRSKENMGAMKPEKFWAYEKIGYQYQYMINTLQLNNGNGTFSDVAQLAGVAKTDWSWSPLFEDLDNDGKLDLYITNGTNRDVRNNDAQVNLEKAFQETKGKADFNQIINLLPEKRISNYCFQNNAELQFLDVTKDWGLYEPSTAQGLAIADLDRDGDLEIIFNREDESASIYENHSNEKSNHHFLQLSLKGPNKNINAIGSKVWVRQNDTIQYKEMYTVRGYQSAQEALLHFGLNSTDKVTVKIEWPDGLVSSETVEVDRLHTMDYNVLSKVNKTESEESKKMMLSKIANIQGFKHLESEFNDFEKEILLPHRYSRLGPFMKSSDVNGDGFEDLFVGAASGQSSLLFLQEKNGKFTKAPSQPWAKYKASEDLGIAFFDVDSDKDLDLLIMPGGNEFPIKSPNLIPHLYLNDGNGSFTEDSKRLPQIITSGAKIAVGDYDLDGDDDLFIAGRITPGFYPFAPRSFLLRNDNGVLVDATLLDAPDLMGPGLITDARFVDMNGDGYQELILVGEWMPISIYENNKGKFKNITTTSKLHKTNGWWNSLAVEDIDGDGDLDIIAGNLGYNSKYKASETEPLHVYCADFDKSGTYDIVLAMHQDEQLFPVRGRECSSQQMPFIQNKFPTYQSFANAELQNIYTDEALSNALHYEAYELASCFFINEGNGRYTKVEMPIHAQRSVVNAIVVEDINGDGVKEIILAGNNYDTEVETVRYDGSVGTILVRNKNGEYEALPASKTGFYAPWNVKDMIVSHGEATKKLLLSTNNGHLQQFEINRLYSK